MQRTIALLMLGALAAGCGSVSQAAAPAVYRAIATARAPGGLVNREVIWYRAGDGAFRITRRSTLDGHRLEPMLTVFDGSRALTVSAAHNHSKAAEGYEGSRAFVASHAGGLGLPLLRRYLGLRPGADAGHLHAQLRGQSVSVSFTRDASAPPAAFRLPTGVKAVDVIKQLPPATDPQLPFPVYWLGASFEGKAATSASSFEAGRRSYYQVQYPGLILSETEPLDGAPPVQRSITVDGQELSVRTATAGPRGHLGFNWSSSSSTSSSSSGTVVVMGLGSGSKPGDEAILLTGKQTEVTILGSSVQGHVGAILAALTRL